MPNCHAMSELVVTIRGVDSLKHELDRTRESLRDTDATIEKLTGRPGFPNQPFARRGGPPRGGEPVGRGRVGSGSLFSLAGYDEAGPPPAKRMSGAFGRLGLPIANQRFAGRRARDDDDEDELPHKLSLQSSVFATPKDTKSRQEAIEEQQSGAGGAAGTERNRRMFGLLLGTLVKFKEDERTKEQQAEKRKAVEQKLEVKQREEHDRLQRERFQLFSDRRKQRAKIRALEQKMELVEIHSAWESETQSLVNFIRTTAKPHIFFLPKSHIPESWSKLNDSKSVLHQLITERRKQLEEELEEIMKEDKDAGNEPMEEYGHSGSENEKDEGDETVEQYGHSGNENEKNKGNESVEQYGHSGSENEADNLEMAEPDTSERKADKSTEKAPVVNEESDLDETETDVMGVDFEQSIAAESAHDVPAADEPTPSEVPEEVARNAAEEEPMPEDDANDKADPEPREESKEADDGRKDLSETSVYDGKADLQPRGDEKRRKEKHRDDDEIKHKERRRRDSSRSHRRREKHGSREHRRSGRDRRHSRSERHRDRDDHDSEDDEKRLKDRHKRKHGKKAHDSSDSDSDSGGDKSKHSAGDDRKSL